MKRKTEPIVLWVSLLALAAGFCAASLRADERRPLSGNYKVISATDVGRGLTRVVLRIRLYNPTADNVSVEKLSMLMEPGARTGHAASLQVSSHRSGEITQEFTVLTGEYRRWQRGGPLMLLVSSPGPDGKTKTVPVRLWPDLHLGVK